MTTGSRRYTRILGPLSLVVVAVVSPSLSDYPLEIGIRLMLQLTLAEAWNLLAGYGGLVSLGTASFVGIGAYTLVGLMNNVSCSPALAIPGAGLAAAGLAWMVSRAVFRLRGLYFTVGTLALAEALRLFMVNYAGFGGAAGLILSVDPPELKELFMLALGILACATLVMTAATQTRFSVLLRAVRDDEDAAAQLGVRPFRVKLGAFVVASFLMGMAGATQGLKLGAVEPYGIFGVHWTISVVSTVIIGGQGLRLGPLVGSVFAVALSELLADYPTLHLAMTGMILVLIVRLAPQGLVGLATRGVHVRTAT
jgi:branched-chain amino acid transport system permease protein